MLCISINEFKQSLYCLIILFSFQNFHFDYQEMKYQHNNNMTITPYIKSSIVKDIAAPFSPNLNRAPLSSRFFHNLTSIIDKDGLIFEMNTLELFKRHIVIRIVRLSLSLICYLSLLCCILILL